MSTWLIVLLGTAGVALLTVSLFALRRHPKKLKPKKFITKWRELQKLCADRKSWGIAITNADALLNDVLKKCRYKGKTVGARLMAAQRQLTDNDGIWAAHSLAKKLKEAPATKLTKTEVRESLESFQQALIDLGAFKRSGNE